MVKKNISIKQTISISNRIAMTNTIVNSNFTTNHENGNITFTPYFREMSQVLCFAEFFLDGVKFTNEENIYETVINDEELFHIYKDTLTNNYCFKDILKDVNDIVAYQQLQIIHNNKSSLNILFDSINELVTSLKDQLDSQGILKLLNILQELGNKTLNKKENLTKENDKNDKNDMQNLAQF